MNFSSICFCACAVLIVLADSARATEVDRLPDRNALLPQLQKIGGKDWNVTTVSDGYLMTYVHPVIFYNPMSTSSKIDLNQRLLHARKDSLRVKIIFGPPLLPSELHWKNSSDDKLEARYEGMTLEQLMWSRARDPNLEMDSIPSQAAAQKGFETSGYYLIEPGAWARSPKYTAYITSNEAPGEGISPREAQESMGPIVVGLDSLFKLGLFIED